MQEERLKKIIKLLDEQQTAITDLTSEIEQLEQAQQNLLTKTPTTPDIQEALYNTEPIVSEYNPEDEMEYYINNLSTINIDTPEITVKALLPSLQNKNATNILLRLKLECIKNMREINELLSEVDDISVEDLKGFKQELNIEQKKLEIINKRLLPVPKEKAESEELQENKLIFVPTTGGNIRVLEELKSIPSEYYERFYGLFSSIKDGTFKNVKSFRRLNNNDPLFCEVKDTAVRVMFARIGPQEYAVITCFIKKTDNNKGYRNQLEQKMGDYKQIAPILIANLENEEFMEQNEKYEQMLWETIKTEKGGKKTYVRPDTAKYRRNFK